MLSANTKIEFEFQLCFASYDNEDDELDDNSSDNDEDDDKNDDGWEGNEW